MADARVISQHQLLGCWPDWPLLSTTGEWESQRRLAAMEMELQLGAEGDENFSRTCQYLAEQK
eukprot:3107601-Lingulodinium_polyedra.AAC.1